MTSIWIRTTAAIAAVVLAIGTTACGEDEKSSAGDGAKQTVKVGGIFDLSARPPMSAHRTPRASRASSSTPTSGARVPRSS